MSSDSELLSVNDIKERRPASRVYNELVKVDVDRLFTSSPNQLSTPNNKKNKKPKPSRSFSYSTSKTNKKDEILGTEPLSPSYKRKLLKSKSIENGYLSDDFISSPIDYRKSAPSSVETTMRKKPATFDEEYKKSHERRFSIVKKQINKNRERKQSSVLSSRLSEISFIPSTKTLRSMSTVEQNPELLTKQLSTTIESDGHLFQYDKSQRKKESTYGTKKHGRSKEIVFYKKLPAKECEKISSGWPKMSIFYSGKDFDKSSKVYEIQRKLKPHLERSNSEELSSPSEIDSSKSKQSKLAKRVWSSIHSLLIPEDKTRKVSSVASYKETPKFGCLVKGLSLSLPTNLDKEPRNIDFWYIWENDKLNGKPDSKDRETRSKQFLRRSRRFDDDCNFEDTLVENKKSKMGTTLFPQNFDGSSEYKNASYSSNGNGNPEIYSKSYNSPKYADAKYNILMAHKPEKIPPNKTNVKKLDRASMSIDTASSQTRVEDKRRSRIAQLLFNGLQANIKSKLKSLLEHKHYEPENAGDWCRALSESIKNRIIQITEDCYKISCQIFLSAILDQGVHSATQTTCNRETDEFFIVAYRGNYIFALAAIVAIEID